MDWEESNLSNVSRQAHQKSDVDSGARAQHHTIGEGPQQAASGKALADLIKNVFLLTHPVGSIFITEVSTNPGTLYGGTWAAYGAGRVIVGLDGTQTEFDTVNETGGAKTHTLTEAELADHDHSSGTLFAEAPGSSHTHSAGTLQHSRGVGTGGSGNRSASGTTTADTAGDVIGDTGTSGSTHEHGVTGLTGGAGSGSPHNNLQPYIVAYMWKRTA